MAQFDVCRLPHWGGDFVVDVQSGFLDELDTRAVVPLVRAGQVKAIRDLTTGVECDGEFYVAAVHLMAPVPATLLRQPVGSLRASRDRIVRAVDMLLSGL